MSVGQSATGTKAAAVIVENKERVWAKCWIRTAGRTLSTHYRAPCSILMSLLLLNCVAFTAKRFTASLSSIRSSDSLFWAFKILQLI